MIRTSALMVWVPPTPLELSLLQDPQQLGLDVEWNLADFIEKDRSSRRQFESTNAAVDRAGEGPFFVAEKFAFDETGG